MNDNNVMNDKKVMNDKNDMNYKKYNKIFDKTNKNGKVDQKKSWQC